MLSILDKRSDKMAKKGYWVEASGVRLPEIEIIATKPIKVPKNLTEVIL